MIRKILLPIGTLALVAMLYTIPIGSQVSLSDAECEAMVGGICLDREVVGHCDAKLYCIPTRKREKCPGHPWYSGTPGTEGKYSGFTDDICRNACNTHCGFYSVSYTDCDGNVVPIPIPIDIGIGRVSVE